AAGAKLSQSKIKVTYAADTYNALVEEGVGEGKTVEFALGNIPNRADEELVISETDSYEYLATAYVLFPGKKTDKVTTDLTLTVPTGLNKDVVIEVPAAPAQRNYRTNVLGNLLTNSADFTVVVDPIYSGDYTPVSAWDGTTVTEPQVVDGKYVITSAAEFAWLSGKTLQYDVLMAKSVDMAGGVFKGMLSDGHAFDGAGYAIYNVTFNYTTEGQDWSSLFVTGGGNVDNSDISVKNLIIDGANVIADKSENGNAAVIASYAEGDVVIENVTVRNSSVNGTLNMGALIGIVTGSSNSTVKNCTVENTSINTYNVANESGNVGTICGRVVGKLTVENTKVAGSTINAYINRTGEQRAVSKYIGNFYGGSNAELTVTGATIEDVTINVLNEENKDQVCIYGEFLGGWQNEGGKVTINGTEYTRNATISDAAAFAEAVKNAKDGDVIQVTGNIAITELKAGANVTIIGMGEDAVLDFTGDSNYSDCSGNITFKGLTIKLDSSRTYYSVGLHNQGGTHVYDNCKFEGVATSWGNCTYNNCTFTNATSGSYAAWVYGVGEVNYNNCTFSGVDRAVKVYTDTDANVTVNYNNCKFIASKVNKTAVEIHAPENNVKNAIYTVNINNAQLTNMNSVAEHYGNQYFNIETPRAIVTVDGETSARVATDDVLAAVLGVSSKTVNVDLAGDVAFNGRTNAYKCENLNINGNGNTLTVKDGYRTYMATAGGKITLKDVDFVRETTGGTHWHDNNMKFVSDVEMNNVTFNKGICIDAVKAVMNNVTITKNKVATYALFVTTGSDVTMDGCTITHADGVAGRGIKVTKEDADVTAPTSLKISNTSFNTVEKAAILVYSQSATKVELSNVNITNVTEDNVNAVWVDEDAADYFDLVTVTGGTKVQE
ncbi:MAG: hypothetical protein IJ328_06355, partial [Muribaculaceae bacterium]|nr:hypothetical protein [Muribaculaceae bacterium]